MNAELKSYKATVREFMRAHYSDERLAMLLAHAQSGRLEFVSCCCFIGVATADHALKGIHLPDGDTHYRAATMLPGAQEAEAAYRLLRYRVNGEGEIVACGEELGQRRLIPMIRAEMRRRERSANLLTARSVTESSPYQGDIITSMEGLVDDVLKLAKTVR